MAIAEACQLWIEQRVEEELEEGKSYRQIGREIASEVERVFEAKVNPETIRKRAERRSKSGTNVPPQPTAQNHSENQENQVGHGGVREGAGRPPKSIVSPGNDSPPAVDAAEPVNAQKSKTAQVKVSGIERLRVLVLSVAEGLTLLADGAIKHTSREDFKADQAICKAAVNIFTQYARLGMDVMAMARIAMDQKEN